MGEIRPKRCEGSSANHGSTWQGNATISDIHFEDITLDSVPTAIQVDMT